MQGFPAIDLSHLDLARCEQRPEQHGHGLGRGQHGLRLDPPPEFLVQPLYRVGRPRRLPLRRIETGESEQAIAGFVEAVRDGAAPQAPFA